MFTTNVFSMEIQRVKAALDQWATDKAPEAWRTKYGARAWEYSDPGDLSLGGPGPSGTEQAALLQQEEEARQNDPDNPDLPDFRNIQKARFNLYLVLYDGSFGVHNGRVSGALLDAASKWVKLEIDK